MVVSLNEAPHLANLKAALDRLQRPPGWRLETILVDGGSTDNSVDVARQAGFDECAVLPGASIPVCRNQAPVSYTHLDVYKRQIRTHGSYLTEV